MTTTRRAAAVAAGRAPVPGPAMSGSTTETDGGGGGSSRSLSSPAVAGGTRPTGLPPDPLHPGFLDGLAAGTVPPSDDPVKLGSLARRLQAIIDLGAWSDVALRALPRIMALLPDDDFKPADPAVAVVGTGLAATLAAMVTSLHKEGLADKPHAAATSAVLWKACDICNWGGVKGKKASVDALFGPLTGPALAVAIDAGARASARLAALEALGKAATRSKAAAAAMARAHAPTWAAVWSDVLPSAGDYGLQSEAAHLLVTVARAGVAGVLGDAAVAGGGPGAGDLAGALRGLARRPGPPGLPGWDEEVRPLLTAFNASRGKAASVVSVKAAKIVARGPAGTAFGADGWVDFGVPPRGGAKGGHATVALMAEGDEEFTLTVPYDAHSLMVEQGGVGGPKGMRLTVSLGSAHWEVARPPRALMGDNEDAVLTLTLELGADEANKLKTLVQPYSTWMNRATAAGKTSIAAIPGYGALPLAPTTGAPPPPRPDWIAGRPSACATAGSPSDEEEVEGMVDASDRAAEAVAEEAIQCAQQAVDDDGDGAAAAAAAAAPAAAAAAAAPTTRRVATPKVGRLAALRAVGGSGGESDGGAATKKRGASGPPAGTARKAKALRAKAGSTTSTGEGYESSSESESEEEASEAAMAAPAGRGRGHGRGKAAPAATIRNHGGGVGKPAGRGRGATPAAAAVGYGTVPSEDEIEEPQTMQRGAGRGAGAGRGRDRGRGRGRGRTPTPAPTRVQPHRAAAVAANARLEEQARILTGSQAAVQEAPPPRPAPPLAHPSAKKAAAPAAPTAPVPHAPTSAPAPTKQPRARSSAAEAAALAAEFYGLSSLQEEEYVADEEGGALRGWQLEGEEEGVLPPPPPPPPPRARPAPKQPARRLLARPITTKSPTRATPAALPGLDDWDEDVEADGGLSGGDVGGLEPLDTDERLAAPPVRARAPAAVGRGSRPRARRAAVLAFDDEEEDGEGVGMATAVEGVARALVRRFDLGDSDAEACGGVRGGGGAGSDEEDAMASLAKSLRRIEAARRTKLAEKMAALAAGVKAEVSDRAAGVAAELRAQAEALQGDATAKVTEAVEKMAAAEAALDAEFDAHAKRVKGLWNAFRAAAGRAGEVAAQVEGAGKAAVAEAKVLLSTARNEVDTVLTGGRHKAQAAKAKWAASGKVLDALAKLQEI